MIAYCLDCGSKHSPDDCPSNFRKHHGRRQEALERAVKPRVNLKSFELDVVVEAYRQEGSAKKAGVKLGISHSSVLRILAENGVLCNSRKWTKQDLEDLARLYPDCSMTVQEIATVMQRSEDAITLKAGRLGIASDRLHRKHTERSRAKMSASQKQYYAKLPELEKKRRSDKQKKWHLENEHPKGMLGKKHSEVTRKAIGEKGTGRKRSRESIEKMVRTSVARYGRAGNDISRMNSSWRAGWREIGGKRNYYRSRWEANYARYLEWLKGLGEIIDWEHEPETFWFSGVKRGCVSYLPDFKVTAKHGAVAFHEVKGWMDDRSKTKIKRMAKYHPGVKLVVIDSKQYAKLRGQLNKVVPGWEP